MEEKLYSQTAEARLFGVTSKAIDARKHNLSSYPTQIAHPIHAKPCRRESELAAYSASFHDFCPGRSLFSTERLAEMTDAEASFWGVTYQRRERVGK